MRMSFRRSVLIFGSACAIFGAAQQADAAGFGIREHSIRANGLSQAYTAIVDDPSAVYYNPGAIGFLRGVQNTFGVTIFKASFDYDSQFTANDADIRTRYLPVPHGFFSAEITDRVTAAFGVYAPYGLSLEWPADAETRYSNIRTSIRAVHYTPAIGIKVTDWLSIGGGFSYVNTRRNVPGFLDKQGREGLRIIRKIDTSDAIFQALRPQLPQTVPDAAVRAQARNIAGTAPEPVLRLKTDGDGFGYTFGFQVRSPNFDKADAGNVKGFLGFTYRSEVNVASQGGDVEFQNVQDPVGLPPGTFTNLFIRGGIRANITLPSNFDIGGAVRLYDRVTLSFDAKWQGWNSFDRVDIRFVTGSPAFVQRLDAKWRDVWSFNFGAEFLAMGSYYELDKVSIKKSLDAKRARDDAPPPADGNKPSDDEALADAAQDPAEQSEGTFALAIRLGYAFDQSPVPTETLTSFLPDNDRHFINTGVGVDFGFVRLDASLGYILFKSSRKENGTPGVDDAFHPTQGKFSGDALVFGFGGTFRF